MSSPVLVAQNCFYLTLVLASGIGIMIPISTMTKLNVATVQGHTEAEETAFGT